MYQVAFRLPTILRIRRGMNASRVQFIPDIFKNMVLELTRSSHDFENLERPEEDAHATSLA